MQRPAVGQFGTLRMILWLHQIKKEVENMETLKERMDRRETEKTPEQWRADADCYRRIAATVPKKHQEFWLDQARRDERRAEELERK